MDNFAERSETGDLPQKYRGLAGSAQVMREIMNSCVWSQEMTAETLLPYLWEESAELSDAVLAGSASDISEELGDVLWQVLFQSAVAERSGQDFSIIEVAEGLSRKMIRRHPHVFAEETATTSEEVLALWNAAKAAEKKERTSVLDGVSTRMPTLSLAQKLLFKAQKLGVDQLNAAQEPTVISHGETDLNDASRLQSDLITLLRNANQLGLDAETELRRAIAALKNEILTAEQNQLNLPST